MTEQFDRVLGAYLGLAIGDALGATVEFMRPREIALQYGVHRDIVGGGWLKLARGQVTDDTTMCLALGDALLKSGPAGLQNFVAHGDETLVRGIAEAYVGWWRGKPVDCGNTCRRGILRFLLDGSLSGPYNDGDGGNGGLMRNLPAVLATLGDDAAFERLAIAQSRITHHHALSDAAVLGVGRLLRGVLAGDDQAELRARSARWVAAEPVFRFTPYRGRATAYVVDTVQTVLHFVGEHEDFEEALVATVNQGDDADTTGALVGMLAGARCGATRLPQRWLRRLQPATVRAITDQTSGLLALAQSREDPAHA
ncbi:MAG: ADP-ribosyl-[dinitrogen reductase] hydrolase [Hydrogenophaga sp.]|uniref:ADP-ribosyl-[dinitrogen reductase] hydrolase n=1 Tax=Hydrogenophaga sp. TaxID=1904254 RepID=UPI002723E5F3|nr:ADP-ribosyl-[dinitrogen reductase] hydrolase [Hydrogenophaga sp.]MDO9480720.1 ADP-ribosyl-[dinitrogen reductase] hydrolase [Hydrogenophaga sp.]MDP3344561.1 ADP-ribosyl-[dinitrogen reductase] hydrolase [Hydrogenophaga sp.]MDP3806547.1 ADP-ribosyl-[dinitrogen reductase] hydrolase [Hydrogenophaga sp.]